MYSYHHQSKNNKLLGKDTLRKQREDGIKNFRRRNNIFYKARKPNVSGDFKVSLESLYIQYRIVKDYGMWDYLDVRRYSQKRAKCHTLSFVLGQVTTDQQCGTIQIIFQQIWHYLEFFLSEMWHYLDVRSYSHKGKSATHGLHERFGRLGSAHVRN